MRTPHYWRKAGAKCAPNNLLFFDCETHFGSAASVAGGELQTLRLGYWMAYRREGVKRTRSDAGTFRTPDAFWSAVRGRLDNRRPLWVFAHNIAYDLGCVNGWKWITGGSFKADKAFVTGSMFYLKGYVDGCGLIFCDTLNYYRCSLAELGRSVGVPKMTMPAYDAPDAEWETYCRNDVEVTAAGVDALRDFNRTNALGPWQPSIAGLAFSAYRAGFLWEKCLVHNYPRPLALERGCYYGGVVDTPVVGRPVPGPVYELDVCSMYPSCCRSRLPRRFRGDGSRYGIRGIKGLAEKYMVAARVDLDTPDYPYPVRQRRGTYFATGRFTTDLAHPELMGAIDRGHVRNVWYVAYYEADEIFREYMQFFADKKAQYTREGNDAFRTLTKYYANSLYGKTGQLSPRWRQWDSESLKVLEERFGLADGELERWYAKPPDLYETEEVFRFPSIPEPIPVRDLFGVVEVQCGETESRESCPIVAATVTSYARELLRGFQATAGRGHWFYSDTDSIWVDATGLENLTRAGCVRDNELGYLSLKETHAWLTVFAPKDYETDLTLKRKGVRASAEPSPSGGWLQPQFPGAMQQLRDGIAGGVYVRDVDKHLRRTLTKCKVLSDGRTRPLCFPVENPERGQR